MILDHQATIPRVTTHRAIVRTAGTACATRTLPTPQPGPGEVLLAPEAVALCGTDIQILRRMRPDPADVVGHEGFARVVATDGTRLVPGQRVMVNPTAPGNPDFLLGHNVPGLFQERVLINAAAVGGGQLLEVPEELDAVTGTLTEPLGVVTYGLECLRLAGARHLVVDGGGLIGLLAAAWAPRVLGPDTTVTVLHRHDDVRRWAEGHVPGEHVRWGADGGRQAVGGAVAGEQTDGALDAAAAEALASVPGDAGLLSAVYRDGTVGRVGRLLGALGERLVGVHTIGGVPSPALLDSVGGTGGTGSAGGVDLAMTRSDNTGGPWPPRVHRAAAVSFTGNRGVTNDRLRRAADDLVAHGADVAALVTHAVDLDEGTALMNRVVGGDRHDPSGSPIVRLAIRLA